MKQKPFLTLDDVKRIAAAAEAEALKNNWPVTIAIVDDGGHLLWLQRLDNAAATSAVIAPAKAKTAALGRRESKVYEDIVNNGRNAFLSVPLEGLLDLDDVALTLELELTAEFGHAQREVALLADLALVEHLLHALEQFRVGHRSAG